MGEGVSLPRGALRIPSFDAASVALPWRDLQESTEWLEELLLRGEGPGYYFLDSDPLPLSLGGAQNTDKQGCVQ